MSGTDGLNPTVVGWRLDRIEHKQEQLADRESVNNIRTTINERGREIDKRIDKKADKDDVTDVREDVKLLAEEVRGLRRVIMGFAVAFATGSIGVSLTLIGTYLH